MMRPAEVAKTIYSGDGDCPPEATSCVSLTGPERDSIYFDIQRMIKWDIPDCALAGYKMQDMAVYGDVRKFSAPMIDGRVTWGYYEPATTNYPEQISFNTLVFQQGYQSDRAVTGVHEGRHAVHIGGTESSVENFANDCINW